MPVGLMASGGSNRRQRGICRAVGPIGLILAPSPRLQPGLGNRLGRWPESGNGGTLLARIELGNEVGHGAAK